MTASFDINQYLYNRLGVDTTQLYKQRTVYNHHEQVKLENRTFDFRIKSHFPKKAILKFLLIDLVNNLDSLAEDRHSVLKNVFLKAVIMNEEKLQHAVLEYGNSKLKSC